MSPPGTFFDCGPLHLITDATLTELGSHHADGAVDRTRFRPNIVVAGAGHGFVENQWLGHTLHIGAQVTVSIVLLAPRCVMTTLAQPDLTADRTVLQIVARTNSQSPRIVETSIVVVLNGWLGLVVPAPG